MALHAQQRLISVEKLAISLAFVLFTAISAATLLARVGIVQPATPDNPFLSYADVFPGQLRRAAVMRDFVCFDKVFPSPADVSEQCAFLPENGLFFQVNVTVWDGVITQLIFTL